MYIYMYVCVCDCLYVCGWAIIYLKHRYVEHPIIIYIYIYIYMCVCVCGSGSISNILNRFQVNTITIISIYPNQTY